MDRKKIIIGINISLAAIMLLFILHYYHFYYHKPMSRFFARKVAIERCSAYLTSNYSMEEIQRMSLYELVNAKSDFPHCFISLIVELPSHLDQMMSNHDSYKKYIGYILLKSDDMWVLIEKGEYMESDRLNNRLAVCSDGKFLEFREK